MKKIELVDGILTLNVQRVQNQAIFEEIEAVLTRDKCGPLLDSLLYVDMTMDDNTMVVRIVTKDDYPLGNELRLGPEKTGTITFNVFEELCKMGCIIRKIENALKHGGRLGCPES